MDTNKLFLIILQVPENATRNPQLSLKINMNKDELKAIGCTSIEDLITEDFGTLGTEERNAFEASCEAFIIGEQLRDDMI